MIALRTDARAFAVATTMLATLLLATACSSGPSKKKKADGDGYLEQGPTVELGGLEGNPASPLEALAMTRQRLTDSEAQRIELEERFRRLKEERDYLEKARLDLESSLTESEQSLEHEREVQGRLAAVVTDLRIRNVKLEQEVFELKVDRITDTPALGTERPRPASQPGDASNPSKRDETSGDATGRDGTGDSE